MKFLKRLSFIKIYIIGALLVIFVSIAGTIIYIKLNSGDYVFTDVTAYDPPYSILIDENANFEFSTTHLNAESIVDGLGIAYDSIKLDDIQQSEGQFVDPDQNYIAYSFYIRNAGTAPISIDYYMRITEVFDGLDEYIRILIIEDDTIYRMYQKADQPDEDNNMPIYNQLPPGINFLSDTMILRETRYNFKPNQVKCFRVIMWLEEQDPNMIDNQQIGRISTQLTFSIDTDAHISFNDNHLLSSEDNDLWLPIYSLCMVQFDMYYLSNDQV
jgi:hypothetical protein